ncbi:hypothetical protein [Salmonirosea aquatica]|uniref:Uncharacterized protein n=1 Tax=Salmonirosea aquatica TaxID=2654236 RepID=A0A7C9BEU8_9BACT|nr:hypothetical protein [Cytophagaceae bacterium SJW1-29]
MKENEEIIPEHYTGRTIDTTRSLELASNEEARIFFEVVKARLLEVNSWGKIAGVATADFQVVDRDGKEVNRPVREGDYFKIDVPGPGSLDGEGHDWVQVEELKLLSGADEESLGIRVRPSANPQSTDKNIAHFYSRESTSIFMVTRQGKKITAGVYDRNTKPNMEMQNPVDKVRHWVVGTSAVVWFSKFQWHQLVKGLLDQSM